MVQVTRLAHVGLRAKCLSTQVEFYNDRWGLERIDEFRGEMFFRVDGPDHHVLTLHAAETSGLHHFAFEVASVEDLDRAVDELGALGLPIITPPTEGLEPGVRKVFYAGEKGIPRVWGPGRHLAGNNLFSYYKDRENNTVEYTSEVEQITAADYAPKVRNPPIPDQWKTVGPSGPGGC
jgi:catechol 2,3-dioxygenase-like lactoylglutathione lyase family enzyme